MSSANPSLPFAQASIPAAPSFWARESASLKLGIKTGLAGTIAYAVYAGFHLHQGYWAVFAALVVTQANVGASWKAALYRTIGSAAGALSAALLTPLLGKGAIGAGVVLFLLASFFGYVAALHPSFTAAGFTAAIILVFGGISEPWHTAWLRVLYTTEGAFIAFAVGAVLWPVHPSVALRLKLARILEGSGELYQAVTTAALQGVNDEEQLHQLDRQLHDLRRGITQQMDEARSGRTFSHFNEGAYQQLVEVTDQTRRRLTAMAEDCSLYVHAQIDPGLLPSLPALAEKAALKFASLAEGVRTAKPVPSIGLDATIRSLDAELNKLRAQRVTSPYTLDRMLPFWALVFNLREIAKDLKELESLLPELA